MDDNTLNPEPPPEENPEPDENPELNENPEPNEKLEVVFDTNDESEALVVKGLLQSNGLEVLMSTPESPSNLFPVSTSDLGEIKLRVRAEQAEEARRMINESREEIPEGEETKDFD